MAAWEGPPSTRRVVSGCFCHRMREKGRVLPAPSGEGLALVTAAGHSSRSPEDNSASASEAPPNHAGSDCARPGGTWWNGERNVKEKPAWVLKRIVGTEVTGQPPQLPAQGARARTAAPLQDLRDLLAHGQRTGEGVVLLMPLAPAERGLDYLAVLGALPAGFHGPKFYVTSSGASS